MPTAFPSAPAAPVVSAQEIYTQTVRSLPPAERLRLAALILGDLTVSDAPPVAVAAPADYKDDAEAEDERYLRAVRSKQARALARADAAE